MPIRQYVLVVIFVYNKFQLNLVEYSFYCNRTGKMRLLHIIFMIMLYITCSALSG